MFKAYKSFHPNKIGSCNDLISASVSGTPTLISKLVDINCLESYHIVVEQEYIDLNGKTSGVSEHCMRS